MQMRDLIDLVRAGLKPSEIKEMIELEKQVKDIDIDEPQQEESTPQPDNESEPKPEPEIQQDTKTAEELKKAQDEIANLKAQIATIQNENKNKDISNNQDKTLDEQIVDIFNQML